MQSGFLTSSIGRKLVMALTGLFLCSFLVVHLLGNLLLFRNDGGMAFNQYSTFMSTNLVIRTIEIGLFASLLIHGFVGIRLWLANRAVRPQQYAVSGASETSPLASRITFVTGGIIFFFLVVHLRTFFFPSRFGGSEPSMYDAVKQAFASPLYSGFYVVALVVLGYHLRHGFQSAFQTFGIRGKKYQPLIEAVGFLFWFVIPLGFATMPLFFVFGLHPQP
jgi:succinate dehydrogenase / fumarate reductase cytochrome b subunit